MDVARPDLKQKKQRKRLILGAIAGAVALLGIVGLSRLEPAAPEVDAAAVWTDVVKRGEMLREVRGPGTLVPKEIRWIAAETSARVERILIKPGATVAADSIVLELSNPEVDEQLLAAQSAVAAAEADYTATRVQLENQLLDQEALVASTEADYEGARLQAEAEGELKRRGIVSAIQYRQSQLRADQLKTKLRIEHAALGQVRPEHRCAARGQPRAQGPAAEHPGPAPAPGRFAARARRHRRRAAAGAGGERPAGDRRDQPRAGGAPGRADGRAARPRDPGQGRRHGPAGRGRHAQRRGRRARVMRIDPAVQDGTVQVDVDLVGRAAQRRAPRPLGRRHDRDRAPAPTWSTSAARRSASPAAPWACSASTPTATSPRRVPVKLGRASVSTIEVAQGLKPGDKVILSDTSAWDEYDRIRLD